MGSARSRSCGTGGKSQVLAASTAQGAASTAQGATSTAQGAASTAQGARSPVLSWGQWHVQRPQGSNRDPLST